MRKTKIVYSNYELADKVVIIQNRFYAALTHVLFIPNKPYDERIKDMFICYRTFIRELVNDNLLKTLPAKQSLSLAKLFVRTFYEEYRLHY